jgi:hypothetical protein
MPAKYATAELEQQAAKYRDADQLHQPDQSQHQVEVAKTLEKGRNRSDKKLKGDKNG